jgi:DUF4097 and DUF4098 domain-containing protein YvlB
MRKAILWAVAILAAATAAWAERPVNESRPVAANAAISIENVAGSLEIIGWDGAEVQVTGTLGDDVEELEIEGSADDLSIEVVIPEDEWKGERKIAADLQVKVPRGASLEIETISASIEIKGVSGEIEAGSVSGTVTVSGPANDVEVESVSGAVTVSGGSGSVAAESVSGEIRLEGVTGEIEAATVSGDIRVEAGAVGDVEIESVAGSVYFEGQLARGSLEIESHSGNVELFLPADLSADFELESFSGGIDNGFGPPAQRTDRHVPGVSVEFTTGSGGAEVSVATFSGNIALKKL